MRTTENEEVNNIILEFFIKCRAQNIPVELFLHASINKI
jgi:hypothetical protein